MDKTNQLKYKDGQGRKIFDPSPVVTLNNTSLEDNSQIPAVAYSEVILRDLQDTGMLDGPFVKLYVQHQTGLKERAYNFSLTERIVHLRK